MRRPTKCPICGNKIVRVTNAVTKNSYFKCSNQECLFVLGEEYTDAEFNLQGQTLKATCLKCHKPLTIVNGPNGLYPRCTQCSCDFEPTFYNGKMYSRWVNARRTSAKEEIEELVKNFDLKNNDDELYDFNAFIASLPEKNAQVEDTNCTKILTYLLEHKDQPIGANELSKSTGIKIGSTRTSLLSLRTLGLVKVVDYIENTLGNHTLLYQVSDSKLPEIKTYHKEDGYNSINTFLRENADKFGTVVRAKEVLRAALKKNNIEPVLFHSSRGICSGYSILKMEELMQQALNPASRSTKNSKKEQGGYIGRKEMKERILKIFQKNINKPYTMTQISEEIKANKCYVKALIKNLRTEKKLKVVGWEYQKGKKGAMPLQYQLTESPLNKFKVTVDNKLYLTFKQFYKKKLSGKRVTSILKAEKIVSRLPVIPLLINQRAYAGYSIADLKNAFKDYVEDSSPLRVKRKNLKKPIPMEVEAALVASTVSGTTSNPIQKKKSLFSSFASLFQKKEKISHP